MPDSTSRRSFLQAVGLGAAALGLTGRRAGCRRSRSRASRRRPTDPERLARLEARLRPQDPRGHRRLRRLPVRRGLRLPGSSQRRGGGRQRPVSRPVRRAGQGLPLREDVSVAGRTGQGRHDRGRLRGDRRPQPCPALHRGAQARQARGLRGAGRLRLARGRRQAVRGGQGERPEVHDVRDVVLPRGPATRCGRSTGRAGSASSSTPRASTTTTWPSRSRRTGTGGSACRRNGIRRTRTPTTWA